MRAEIVELIVGLQTLAGARVYQRILPQNTQYPAIAVSQVSAVDGQDLDGTDGSPRLRITVDIWGEGDKGAVDIAKTAIAIRDGLKVVRGLVGTYRVDSIVRVGETDLDEVDGDRFLPRISQDYLVTLSEG